MPVQEIFCSVLAAVVGPVQNIFSSPYAISITVSPSPRKLGRQPCWVAFLLLCLLFCSPLIPEITLQTTIISRYTVKLWKIPALNILKGILGSVLCKNFLFSISYSLYRLQSTEIFTFSLFFCGWNKTMLLNEEETLNVNFVSTFEPLYFQAKTLLIF